MSKRLLLNELRERLSRLRTVASTTVAFSMSYAESEVNAADLKWYLERVLPIIEEYVEKADLEGFEGLCREMRYADDETLKQILGVPPDMPYVPWGMAAFQLMSISPSMALYAISNHFGSTVMDLHREPMLLCGHIANLASLLGLNSRPEAGTQLYEMVLGWSRETYKNKAQISHDLNHFANNKFLLLQALINLISGLQESARNHEAEVVLLAGLGFLGDEDLDGRAIGSALENLIIIDEESSVFGSVDELPPEVQVSLKSAGVSMFVAAVQVLSYKRPHIAHQVLLAFFNTDETVEDIAGVANKLRALTAPTHGQQIWEVLFGQWLRILNALDRPKDTVVACEAFLAIDVSEYSTEIAYAEAANRYREEVKPVDDGNFIFTMYSTALRRIGRPLDAAFLMAAAFAEGVEGDLLTLAILGARKKRRETRQVGHLLTGIASWIRSLSIAGRDDEAFRVAFEVLGDLEWLEAKDGRLIGGIDILVPAYEMLNQMRHRRPDFAVSISRRIVESMRISISDSQLSAVDRQRRQADYIDIRKLIIQVGYDWISRAEDLAERTERWKETLQWEAELGHRMVLERYLENKNSISAASVVDNLDDIEQTESEDSTGKDLDNLCFGYNENQLKNIVELGIDESAKGFEIDESLATSLRRGISEADIAGCLLPSEKLLRVGFCSDGSLLWGLFAKKDKQLQLLAEGQGKRGDREQLRKAVQQYDVEQDLIWFSYPKSSHGIRESILEACDDATDSMDEQMGIRNAFFDEIEKLLGKARSGLLTELFAADLQREITEQATSDKKSHCLTTVRRLASLIGAKDSEAMRYALNISTNHLLQAMQGIWNLEVLVQHLDPQKDDLIVQVDSELLATPIPFFLNQGTYLFEYVHSIRSVLTVVLNGWMREKEAKRAIQEQRRGLVFSAFQDSDRAGLATNRLVSKLKPNIGSWEWKLADRGRGNFETLSRAVRVPLNVLVMLGHGQFSPSGIRLRDGIWSGTQLYRLEGDQVVVGEECRLTGVEFLIQVSCCIGRVAESAEEDVTGFCVESILADARAVIAAKWPICAADAPLFAAEVITQYQRSRDENVSEEYPTNRCLRARAVAAARRKLLKTNTVSLNTLAAFELYGLG